MPDSSSLPGEVMVITLERQQGNDGEDELEVAPLVPPSLEVQISQLNCRMRLRISVAAEHVPFSIT